MPLSDQQRDALEQLWAVTASETDASRQRDERMLIENGFDVQVSHLPFSFVNILLCRKRTVEQIFSTDQDAPAAGSRSGPRETFEFEDASHSPRPPAGSRRLSGPGPRRQGSGTVASTGLNLWSTITLPVRLVIGILSGTWYFLGTSTLPTTELTVVSTLMPISFLRYMPRYLLPPSSAPTPRPPRDPTTVSLSFVRDLEQFTGCSAASGTMLDFWVGPYREFLTDVRKQAKIGMVVLVSEEHENDEEFKRDVLCDPELVRFVKEKDIMVWGADIRSREGYQGKLHFSRHRAS
jgi:FAS-associated factor 2